MPWKKLLANVTGSIDEELRLRNEYLVHLGTRTVHIGGITPNPDQRWIAQIIRNITDVDEGMLVQNACRYVIHDRDGKFCQHFERNHQGIGNNLVFPDVETETCREGPVECRERIGGLLKFHHRQTT